MIEEYRGYKIRVNPTWGKTWEATITTDKKASFCTRIGGHSTKESAMDTARSVVDAVIEESSPHPGEYEVLPKLLAAVQARAELGKRRYGTTLQTFNGRCAINDAEQELIDLLFYLKQHEMELNRILDDVEKALGLAVGWIKRPEVRYAIQIVLDDVVGWRSQHNEDDK